MYTMNAGFGWTAVGVGRCVFRALVVMIFLSFFFLSCPPDGAQVLPTQSSAACMPRFILLQ